MSSIKWQNNLGWAEDSAISERKSILLDYYDPDCIGCKQMDALTYRAQKVVNFINDLMIPVRLDFNNKALYDNFNAIWTPTLLVLDYQGHEVQKIIGFLKPEKFLAMMHLGIAKVHLTNGEFDTANVHLKRLMDNYPESTAIPEAIYFSGVNLYKQKNDPGQLKIAYEKLISEYPDSSWAKRAEPYKQL